MGNICMCVWEFVQGYVFFDETCVCLFEWKVFYPCNKATKQDTLSRW